LNEAKVRNRFAEPTTAGFELLQSIPAQNVTIQNANYLLATRRLDFSEDQCTRRTSTGPGVPRKLVHLFQDANDVSVRHNNSAAMHEKTSADYRRE
jgi:hypothetical protein